MWTLGCVLVVVLLLGVAHATVPIAPMLAIRVGKNGEVEVPLVGYDADGDKLTAKITSVPSVGSIWQLSQIYSDFGYEPKRGVEITSGFPLTVSGSGNRVVYTPPAHTNEPDGHWAMFTYTVSDATATSVPGIVWLVPTHSRMEFSDFATTLDGWVITENGARASAMSAGGLTYEPYSRGVLNHYVLGTDAEIHTDRLNGDDLSRWYFVAPSKFLGNHIVAYGGTLVFAMAPAAGDFSANNRNSNAQFVILECDSCASGAGIRLAWYTDDVTLSLDGSTTEFRLPLVESKTTGSGITGGSGWLKDPKNTLLPWAAPTQCEMVEVLQGLTSVRVLGDWSQWYESVALDRFGYEAGTSVPVSCVDIYY